MPYTAYIIEDNSFFFLFNPHNNFSYITSHRLIMSHEICSDKEVI